MKTHFEIFFFLFQMSTDSISTSTAEPSISMGTAGAGLGVHFEPMVAMVCPKKDDNNMISFQNKFLTHKG